MQLSTAREISGEESEVLPDRPVEYSSQASEDCTMTSHEGLDPRCFYLFLYLCIYLNLRLLEIFLIISV